MKRTEKLIEIPPVGMVRPLRRGVELELGNELMRVELIQDEILRLKISKDGRFDPQPSFAVIRDEFGTPEFQLEQSDGKLSLTGKKLAVEIQFNPFSYRVSRSDGSVVVQSVPGGSYRYLNNEWAVKRVSSASDAYFGFGEKTGKLNQNGRYLQMWNTDIMDQGSATHPRIAAAERPQIPAADPNFDPYYMSIPFYYHLKGTVAAGFFIDNVCHMHFDLTQPDEMEFCAENGQYCEYIISGPEIGGILKHYNELTGRPSPVPLWALGHHQCRWFPYDAKSFMKLARDYRKSKVPCDTLWMDIDYMDGFRVFTWNKDRYPDIDATLAELKKMGYRVITIIDPGVKFDPGYPVFDEGLERDIFCKTESGQLYTGSVWPGLSAFPDFVRESARTWWGRLNADHVKKGLAGIWNDMNEPASWIDVGSMRFDDGRASHDRWHNAYAMLMAMGTYEGLKRAMPGLRTFILSRAGSAGSQRYAANWTGDNDSRFDHLAMSATMNCNLALSGQPFVGSDIGGFGQYSNAELLTRWYQYGVYMPFMRNHNAEQRQDQYPWSFGSETETLVRAAVEERYRLLPYIYTAVMRYAVNDVPLQRPLVFDYQSDGKCRDNYSEYLFGPDMLVAPIAEAGLRRRSLYMPAGAWYEFHTRKAYKGGRRLTVEAPLEYTPVFVKAGAIVPTAPVRQSTMEPEPECLTLQVYWPTADGEFTSYLYEDDGLTENCVNGEFRSTRMVLTRRGGTVRISGRVDGRGYLGAARKQLRFEFIGADVANVVLKNSGTDFDIEVAEKSAASGKGKVRHAAKK